MQHFEAVLQGFDEIVLEMRVVLFCVVFVLLASLIPEAQGKFVFRSMLKNIFVLEQLVTIV